MLRSALVISALVLSGCSEQPLGSSGPQGVAGHDPSSAAGPRLGAELPRQGGSGSTTMHTDIEPTLELRAERTTLVSHAAWRHLEPEADPFSDRPKVVSCDDQAVGFEVLQDEVSYGVDTGICNYVTAYQRTLTDVRAGERLVVRLWHFELSAPEPAQAHVAVMLDGERLLDVSIPIPSSGGLVVRELAASHSVAQGAPIFFHLHNHGENSWALIEISTGP